MKKQELEFPLIKLKDVIHKWLYMENDTVIDVVAAVYIANRFDAEPVWLLIIAPPSNTKTELLRAFEGHEDACLISNLTPATLVSGIKSKKGDDPSLLPKLNDKLVILKDFTTILSMRSENQQEIISQLREAYDGQYTKIFGNGKKVDWSGRFGLIGACTPIYDRHYGVIGSMGERFLLYRTESANGLKMGLQAQRIVGQEVEMRTEIRKALHRFIDQFQNLNGANFDTNEDINYMIVALANFVAYCRCPVERDYQNKHISYQPMPEGTPRLVKQFMQLGMGFALAYETNTIDETVYKFIKKIGCDLISLQRFKILKYLFQQKAFEYLSSWEITADVAEGVNLPVTTTKLTLEDLMVVGVLNREMGESDGGRPPYKWQLNQQISEWIGQAEVFDDD